MVDLEQYRVVPGEDVDLNRRPTDDDGGMDKNEAHKRHAELTERLIELQELLYAEAKQSLLVVLQAMDTGGKDSTIRKTLGPLNPQGVRVWNFLAPTGREIRHDYLWRVHRRAPAAGYIGVFNRSHYEDVLVVRVKDLVPEAQWRSRYRHINEFERMLVDEGTRIVKIFLHISKRYQKKRLERRLSDPKKYWKFSPDDLVDRGRWKSYTKAYEDALSHCSTDYAPWYIIPGEHRWYRDVLVAQALVNTLESMDMHFPTITFNPADITIE